MITHILKDGTITQNIIGHLVKREDCETVYKIIERRQHDNLRTDQSGKRGNQNNRH